IEAIVDEVIAAFGARACAVAELSADGRELAIVQSRGYAGEELRPSMRIPVDRRGPTRDAVITGEPVFIGSAAELMERYPEIRRVDSRDAAWVALPLRARGRSIGALTLTFERPREFTEADRTFAAMLASQCAQALDRA